jgi:hypothetical protein
VKNGKIDRDLRHNPQWINNLQEINTDLTGT